MTFCDSFARERFAPDSTGFSNSRFVRWFDEKYGTERSGHAWVKARAMTGCLTNIITAVVIDNAPVESFFGRLKCELAPDGVFATRDQARAALFDYLEVFYNRVRRHSSLGFVSPTEFERAYHLSHR